MTASPDVVHQLVQRLLAAFPATKIGDETLALWVSQLKKVSEQTARAGVEALIREQRRFPVPADFWRAVEAHRNAVAPRPTGARALPSVTCDECAGTGLTFRTPPDVTPGDVVACSRGCMPPRPTQQPHAMRERHEDDRQQAFEQIDYARTLLHATRRAS